MGRPPSSSMSPSLDRRQGVSGGVKRRPSTALAFRNHTEGRPAVATILPDGTFIPDGNSKVTFDEQSSQGSRPSSAAGLRHFSSTSFTPLIRGRGNKDDGAAGIEGVK